MLYEYLKENYAIDGILTDKEKDAVLAIIDKDISDEQKKTEIKAIENGAVWKKMLKEVYPHLRTALYLTVYYGNSDSFNKW